MPAQSHIRLILAAPAAVAVGSPGCELCASLTATPTGLQTIAQGWLKPCLGFNPKAAFKKGSAGLRPRSACMHAQSYRTFGGFLASRQGHSAAGSEPRAPLAIAAFGFNTEGVVELSPGLPKRAKASLGYPGLPRSGKVREPWTMPAPVAARSALPQHRWPLAVLGRGASGERDTQPCHGFARPRGARKPRVGLASLGQPWAQFHNTFGVKNQLTHALADQRLVASGEALARPSGNPGLFSTTPLGLPRALSVTGDQTPIRSSGL